MKAIPIIAVTSFALAWRRGEDIDAGCNAYVTKHYGLRALLAKVREYLVLVGTRFRWRKVVR